MTENSVYSYTTSWGLPLQVECHSDAAVMWEDHQLYCDEDKALSPVAFLANFMVDVVCRYLEFGMLRLRIGDNEALLSKNQRRWSVATGGNLEYLDSSKAVLHYLDECWSWSAETYPRVGDWLALIHPSLPDGVQRVRLDGADLRQVVSEAMALISVGKDDPTRSALDMRVVRYEDGRTVSMPPILTVVRPLGEATSLPFPLVEMRLRDMLKRYSGTEVPPNESVVF